MTHDNPARPPLVERLERALILLAYFIELDGDVHIPLYERCEAELMALRSREGAKDRARRLAAAAPEPVAVAPAPEPQPVPTCSREVKLLAMLQRDAEVWHEHQTRRPNE